MDNSQDLHDNKFIHHYKSKPAKTLYQLHARNNLSIGSFDKRSNKKTLRTQT